MPHSKFSTAPLELHPSVFSAQSHVQRILDVAMSPKILKVEAALARPSACLEVVDTTVWIGYNGECEF